MQLTTFFQDLKIVELASVLAGPAVGSFFAEMGATVIKIENKKTGGDMTRHWRLKTESPDTPLSSYYCSVNYAKQALLLDLTDERDYNLLKTHLREADIVISNYNQATAKKLNVDETSIREINPNHIFAHLSAFGDDSNRPAFDMVLQAEAGFLYMCGEPDRPPVKMPVALIDILAAHQLKEGILMALLHKYKTGKGSSVKTSLLEAAIASLANQAGNWLNVGHIPQAMGSQHPNIAPYGDVFYTKDQKSIILAVGTARQWQELCRVLKVENLEKDERFNSNVNRLKHRTILVELLQIAFLNWKHDVLLPLFHQHRIPIGTIRSMPEVFELEQAKDMILTQEITSDFIAKSVKTVAFSIKSK